MTLYVTVSLHHKCGVLLFVLLATLLHAGLDTTFVGQSVSFKPLYDLKTSHATYFL